MGIEFPKFNEMTTGQKVATVAGATAAVGAVAATVVAGVKGKTHLEDIKKGFQSLTEGKDKFIKTVGEGEAQKEVLTIRGKLSAFGKMMKEGFVDEWNSIKKVFTRNASNAESPAAAPAAEAAAE